MSSNQLPSSSSKKPSIPVWVQVTAGLSFIVIVLMIALNSNPYVSAWDEEKSSVYQTATQALKIFSLNPTSPTAFIFWDKEMSDSGPALKAFGRSPSNLRIYGVHLSTDQQMEVRKTWLKFAPRRAALLIDRQQLLQTAFRARAFPMVYIVLPKQKKIYSYLGNIDDNRERMLEIIKSE